MKPTYSVTEIKSMIATFDLPELDLLTSLVQEEQAAYHSDELNKIKSLVGYRKKEVTANELQLEYLLSFN